MKPVEVTISFNQRVHVTTQMAQDCTRFAIEVHDTGTGTIIAFETSNPLKLKALGTALKVASDVIRKVQGDNREMAGGIH